ncbi:MAG: DUF2807 domain-containing protein [Bacteroidetes bacterium]|nr:DUF2807 domain-containing protein [Bacteroidota bacterium]
MKNTMEKSWLFAIAIFLMFGLSSGCTFAGKIKGNGNVVTQERQVRGFNSIQVGGAFKVILTQGQEEYLQLELEENLMDKVITEVVGGELKIYTKDNINAKSDMIVRITFKNLEELDISGACDVSSANTFKLGELELEASGASEIDLEMTLEKLECNCSGASNVDLKGNALSMDLDLSGASNIDALEFEVEVADIEVSGAADAKIFASKKLNAGVSGAASIRYKGTPAINTDISGAGSIKQY